MLNTPLLISRSAQWRGGFLWCVLCALALLIQTPNSLAVQAPVDYQFRIINSYPHARDVFTQGLEFHNDLLYESAGQYGQSRLFTRKLNAITPITNHSLSKNLFAEGITLLKDQLYQLTWRSGRAFTYQADTLTLKGEFTITGEGWGLTNNGKHLIVSNGSHRLRFLDPKTAAVLKTLEVTFQGRALNLLNELEWVDGLIYANVWQSNWIVMIDPDNGTVVGKVDLSNLLPSILRTASTGVLNGIAHDRKNDRLFITGKNWPKLYQIELIPKTVKTALKLKH
ncbi:MAG: glutaminyl-peptide cyclotransferase [Spongiibacteraceae bacterium]|nr:glutaminyl-peptide cyclotransferase [Spongiibacteraceae bacterium]